MADTVMMPKLGFDMAEGTLVRWVKKEGDQVKKTDILAEIETDKATVEVESGFTGEILRFLVEQGSSVPVGQPIAVIGKHGEKVEVSADAPVAEKKEKPAAAAAAQPSAPVSESGHGNGGETEAENTPFIKASPLAKRIAMEKDIDLADVKGSGPGGRIVRRDVEKAAAAGPAARLNPAAVQPVAGRNDITVPAGKLRSIIARRMQESKQTIPHFYLTRAYDTEQLLKMRVQANAGAPENERLSVNDFIIKVAAMALRKFPNLNASLAGDKIIQHGHINIGVAVAVENGLMTVVCRDADQKSIRQISREVKEMASRAREGKVKPEDIEGSTFSISNLGMYGVEEFAAIINSPEAAILAVSAAQDVPVVKDGVVLAGKQMKMTISVDHRISDGVEAAQFMKELASYIEMPANLLVEI